MTNNLHPTTPREAGLVGVRLQEIDSVNTESVYADYLLVPWDSRHAWAVWGPGRLCMDRLTEPDGFGWESSAGGGIDSEMAANDAARREIAANWPGVPAARWCIRTHPTAFASCWRRLGYKRRPGRITGDYLWRSWYESGDDLVEGWMRYSRTPVVHASPKYVWVSAFGDDQDEVVLARQAYHVFGYDPAERLDREHLEQTGSDKRVRVTGDYSRPDWLDRNSPCWLRVANSESVLCEYGREHWGRDWVFLGRRVGVTSPDPSVLNPGGNLVRPHLAVAWAGCTASGARLALCKQDQPPPPRGEAWKWRKQGSGVLLTPLHTPLEVGSAAGVAAMPFLSDALIDLGSLAVLADWLETEHQEHAAAEHARSLATDADLISRLATPTAHTQGD